LQFLKSFTRPPKCGILQLFEVIHKTTKMRNSTTGSSYFS